MAKRVYVLLADDTADQVKARAESLGVPQTAYIEWCVEKVIHSGEFEEAPPLG